MFDTINGARLAAKRIQDRYGFKAALSKEVVARAGGWRDWHSLEATVGTANAPRGKSGTMLEDFLEAKGISPNLALAIAADATPNAADFPGRTLQDLPPAIARLVADQVASSDGVDIRRARIAVICMEAHAMVAPADIDAILPADEDERRSQWELRNHRGTEKQRRYDTAEISSLVRRVYDVFGLLPELVEIEEDRERPSWTMVNERHHSFLETRGERFIVGPEDAVRNAFRDAIELSVHIQRAEDLEDMGIALSDAPPWAFVMHPVARALLEHIGIDPADATRHDASKRTHPSFRPERLSVIHRGHSRLGSLFSSIDGMHAKVSRLDVDDVSYHEGGFVSITIRGDGVRQPRDYVGLTVGEATGHPALADVPVRIRDAWENGGVQMQLEPVFAPVEPLPEGVGGNWTRHLPVSGEPLWRT